MNILRTTLSIGLVIVLCLLCFTYTSDAFPAQAPTPPITTAAVSKPAWLDYIEAGSKIVTSLGIVLGGLAAYYKFLRGRIFHARLDIAMSSSFHRIRENLFLQVQAEVKNTGASHVRFSLEESILSVYGANHAQRTIADDAEWKNLATVDAIRDKRHKWIEPAETICLNWLIDLPRDLQFEALRSELLLSSKKIVWQADTVAISQPLEQSTSAVQGSVEEVKMHNPPIVVQVKSTEEVGRPTKTAQASERDTR